MQIQQNNINQVKLKLKATNKQNIHYKEKIAGKQHVMV